MDANPARQIEELKKHVYDLERDIEAMKEAAVRDEGLIRQLGVEIAFVEEQHAQTSARKSNLMRDWLSDQTVKWKLRCQVRENGHEPTS